MALRVLLADESSTIKKVIQLALQDFGVEVKSVHSGVDVLAVAKTFRPDIFFVDVLLQKRNGYEVAYDLHADSDWSEIPVVLMWSSFMELDEQAATRAQAKARLEKPFDSEALRGLVQALVPRTHKQTLSNYLEFPPQASVPPYTPPPLPAQQVALAHPAAPAVAPQAIDNDSSGFRFSHLPDSLPDPSADQPGSPSATPFSVGPLSSLSNERPKGLADERPNELADEREDENWSHQDLGRFKLNLEPMQIVGEDTAIHFDVDHGQIDGEKLVIPTQRPESFDHRTATNFQFLADDSDRSVVEEIAMPREYVDSKEETNVLSSFEVENAEQFDADRSQTNDVFRRPASAFADVPIERRASAPQMNAEHLEKIIRAQSQEIIEAVVRKVVPELATRLIREELERLLAEGPP